MPKMRQQTAALPLQRNDKGEFRLLMVTSRRTRRWVMPKGWMMDDHKPWEAAKIEALEEAGAEGRVGSKRLGEYRYEKLLENGNSVWCRVSIYPMMVRRLKKRWKERGERTRRWFTLKSAAKRVDEPELSELLLKLDKDLRKPEAVDWLTD